SIASLSRWHPYLPPLHSFPTRRSSDLSLHRTYARCRNINLLPIDYAFLPRLRGRLTLRRLTLRKETLGFRRAGFSPALSLLMSAFALPIPPASFSTHLHRLTERSSTAHHKVMHPKLRFTA